MTKNTSSRIGMARIDPEQFRFQHNGLDVALFTLKNKNGLEVTVTNFGLRVLALFAPDINNKFEDIVLGCKDLKSYRTQQGAKYFGCIAGQYANRIEKGLFSIDGKKYQLSTNLGEDHLHGGEIGFSDTIWNVERVKKDSIVFNKRFEDGQNGYPGNVHVRVTYTLTHDNGLKMHYRATTNQPTIINLTHHSYFNLEGEGNGSILDHVLTMNADYYTPINEKLIPKGSIETVENTPFDFRKPMAIRQGLSSHTHNDQLNKGLGYDHNFVLNATPKDTDGLGFAAQVKAPKSGRVMAVYTSEPGIQLYIGNHLDGSVSGKSDIPYLAHSGLCLETQHFPNSPNIKTFPNTILRPNEVFLSTTVYKFSSLHPINTNSVGGK